MLPKSLALIDDDMEYAEFLARNLRSQGVEVDLFADSNLLVASTRAYDYGFYLVDLMLPGINGVDLIKVLRLRTDAGIVVVSGRLAPEVFDEVMSAGADMYLAKPATFNQVTLAVKSVQRRAEGALRAEAHWSLDARVRQLVAPDGARVDLSAGDLRMLERFVEAEGAVVSRETLQLALNHGEEGDAPSDGVYAAVYRLRRRIEKATSIGVPLQSKARVGYVFKAKLKPA